MTVFKMNGQGHLEPVLDVVKIGNERLDSHATAKLTNAALVICLQHSTAKRCYVYWRGIGVLACRKCILEHCKLTKAVLRPNWDAHRGNLDTNNPAGHSF